MSVREELEKLEATKIANERVAEARRKTRELILKERMDKAWATVQEQLSDAVLTQEDQWIKVEIMDETFYLQLRHDRSEGFYRNEGGAEWDEYVAVDVFSHEKRRLHSCDPKSVAKLLAEKIFGK